MEISNKNRLIASGPGPTGERPGSSGSGAGVAAAGGGGDAERVPTTPIEKKIDEAARAYEKQFLREMVKAMRSATSASEFMKPGMAENLYREQLDDQYVEAWGERGGLGFHKIIYDQLSEMMGLTQQPERPRGPTPLTERDVLRSVRSRAGRSLRVDLGPQKPGEPPSGIVAPWDATVASASKGERTSSVSLSRAGGGELTFVFEGTPSASLAVGARVAAGERIGLLSPEARAFFANAGAGAGADDASGAR